MAQIGFVEILSPECAFGWVGFPKDEAAAVYATLDGVVIGTCEANVIRADLKAAHPDGDELRRGFTLVYRRPVPEDRFKEVLVHRVGTDAPLPPLKHIRFDRSPSLKIFILGSPRSGTSELGATLTSQLGLPWLGEGHAAPLFAAAADALKGDITSANGFVRAVAQQNYRQMTIDVARRSYFVVHASASFLDKTPGVPMISAAPFLVECFPDAKFIYLRRNGISNLLSRMTKFGGNFQAHCRDWSSSLEIWLNVREKLHHYIEIDQETMSSNPDLVATTIADYLGTPDMSANFANSLRSGKRERTGAGVGKSTLSQTGWSSDQIELFRHICGPTMQKFGYPVDA